MHYENAKYKIIKYGLPLLLGKTVEVTWTKATHWEGDVRLKERRTLLLGAHCSGKWRKKDGSMSINFATSAVWELRHFLLRSWGRAVISESSSTMCLFEGWEHCTLPMCSWYSTSSRTQQSMIRFAPKWAGKYMRSLHAKGLDLTEQPPFKHILISCL